MSETTLEYLIYGLVLLLCAGVVGAYLLIIRRRSEKVAAKIRRAVADGLHEPVSLHPVVDGNRCIQTGACVAACPEKDILGIRDGQAATINASRCVGHGACFHACPTQAITLCIGTEKRGVELPHVSPEFETNVPGIYIAGELGGMGLIKNAVEQGRQAVENMVKAGRRASGAEYDLIIVGAGPAGISASLAARKHQMKFLTLEQDTLGGTVYSFPRAKIVMTSPMDLPLHGKVKLTETSKSQLLELWIQVLDKHDIVIRENTKADQIIPRNGHFCVKTASGQEYTTSRILLAIGRRGTPRKLGIPGEGLEKVTYRLLDPELYHDQKIMVAGGGDSAIEAALMLAGHNSVTLVYRGDSFSRIKPGNLERITTAARDQQLRIMFRTNPLEIREKEILLSAGDPPMEEILPNDLVFIFAGGELPTDFLKKAGIMITKKFGEAILKH